MADGPHVKTAYTGSWTKAVCGEVEQTQQERWTLGSARHLALEEGFLYIHVPEGSNTTVFINWSRIVVNEAPYFEAFLLKRNQSSLHTFILSCQVNN